MASVKKKSHKKEDEYFKDRKLQDEKNIPVKRKRSHEKENTYFNGLDLERESNNAAKKRRSHEKEAAYFKELDLEEKNKIINPVNRIKKHTSEKKLLKIFKGRTR